MKLQREPTGEKARRRGSVRRAGTATKSRILRGASNLFFQNGYHGTSMRDVAGRAGLRASSLYRHVKSKQELLYAVMDRLMDEVLEGGRKALEEGENPRDRIRHLVYNNICLSRPEEAALLQSDLRNLTPRYRSRIIKKRDEYQKMWLSVIQEGVVRGEFSAENPKIVFFGIIGSMNYVEFWYRPDGPLSREEVAEIFSGGILRSLGAEQ